MLVAKFALLAGRNSRAFQRRDAYTLLIQGGHMFRTDAVEISFNSQQNSVKKFAGQTRRGVQYLYDVTDGNFGSRNTWFFEVFVPQRWGSNSYVSVQPVIVPNRAAWAGMNRRSLQFAPASIGQHKGRCYAKLAIADIEGAVNRRYVSKDDPLPKNFDFTVSIKKRVAPTQGTDSLCRVAILEKEDHASMIRLFLALKPWVLSEGYSPEEAGESRRRAKKREAKLKGNVKGLGVAVTGRLGRGTRPQVFKWLRRLGARPQDVVSSATAMLVVGPHYKGESRKKIKAARKLGLPQMTESSFIKNYIR